MNPFEEGVQNNQFVCSECAKCNALVWPPNEFCSMCFGKVHWRQVSKKGKLVEYSKEKNTFFCIAEFEKSIRIMGQLETGLKSPQIGQDLELVLCSQKGKEKFLFQLL